MTVDSVDIFEQSYTSTYVPPTPPESTFHEVIYPHPQQTWTFSRKATHDKTATQTEEKTSSVFQKIKPMEDSGGSVTAGFKMEWGGKDGPSGSGYVKGEYHDDNGNYVEGKIEQNSDGSGSVDVSAGTKSENGDDK